MSAIDGFMGRTCFFLALALVLLVGCQRGGMKQPQLLLTEEQMVDVLADSYLIEAELNQKKSVGENVTDLQVAYYQQLFEHYGITDSIFDENMAYYTYQLPILERIMDSVNARFVKLQTAE